MKTGTTNLTEGSITSKLLLYFLPICAGNLFQQFYNAVDCVVVGKFVGTDAIAAVGGSSASIVSVFTFLNLGLISGASVVIAQFFGAGDEDGVSRASHTGFAFAALLGVIYTVLMLLLCPAFLVWMKTPDQTMADAIVYCRTYFSGTLFFMVYNMAASVLRAVGDSKRPFIYLVISCFVNIVLDLTFVIAFSWDVFGVAIATVTAQAVSFVLVLFRVFRTKECYRICIKKLKIEGLILRRMLKIGIPAMLQSLMYNISNMLVQVSINTLGTSYVAGWVLSSKIDGFNFAITEAAGTAEVTFAGQNYGAGRFDRIKQSVNKSLLIFVSGTIVFYLAVYAIGPDIFRLLSNDAEVIGIAWEIMCYFIPLYWTWTVVSTYSSVLRGCNDAVVPVIICAVGICVFRVLWVLILFDIYPTIKTVSICYPISWIITAIPMAVRYYTGRRKQAGLKA